MTGSNASQFTPLTVGFPDSGDFSSYLGRPTQIEEETYVMLQANVAIASGSNGKQLQTAISSGQASWVVVLATGGASTHLACGAIPWTLTGPISSGQYFLAVRDSAKHVMLERGTLSGCIEVGAPLIAGSGADLINVTTGLGVIFSQLKDTAATCLTADTGVVAVSGWVRYRAPFRGAD